MTREHQVFSLDHPRLLDSLLRTDKLLIIQDLDGVCMGLVHDPLTRTIERRYVEAARRLAGSFYVLTNGEHIGSRGVNGIVERALDTPTQAKKQGLYLPGLGAGGVQLQDRHGKVSHPGVSEAELGFLQAVPDKARRFLGELLAEPPYGLGAADIAALVAASVLDNLASPTLNINSCYQQLRGHPGRYRRLQDACATFLQRLQQDAASANLQDAFFVHLAPNLGSDAQGRERLRYGDEQDAGTTDFQFMLRGAIKEVGVLVILNHYYHQRTGRYPLGPDFNARQAPREHDALLRLAREHFDPAQMPRIVGVGDTVTSSSRQVDGGAEQLRGGSDRGFLSLVQALGEAFDSDNRVVYVDSSAGEVARPGLDAAQLRCGEFEPWAAALGISDPADPLRLDVVFTGGHSQYVAFFCALAEHYAGRRE